MRSLLEDIRIKIEGTDKINRIVSARAVLTEEINGDWDKFLLTKALVGEAFIWNNTVITASVLLLLALNVVTDDIVLFLKLAVAAGGIAMSCFTARQRERNKYIKVILDDMEKHWDRYFNDSL